MNKSSIFHKTVEKITQISGVQPKKVIGVLTFYEYDFKKFKLSLQSDFDNHLESLIEIDNRVYSNGGDFMKKNDWNQWQETTITTVIHFLESANYLEEEWFKKEKYIGGYIAPTNKNNKIFRYSNINNNFSFFKRKIVSIKSFKRIL